MISSFLGSRWRLLIVAFAIVALLVAGGGWYYYYQYLPTQTTNGEEKIQTATVRRGSIVLLASGTGTLVPAAEVSLGFGAGGDLVDLPVQVGDQVEAGDILARLDNTDAQSQVSQDEINLRLAELQLSELTSGPDTADLASAQAQLTSAEEALKELVNSPSPEEMIIAQADLATAEKQLQQAQSAYDQIAWRPGASATSQAMDLWQATAAYDKAKANYDMAVAGPTEQQIAAAQATLAQAQAQLDSVLNAVSPEDVETAQLSVEQARLNLLSAQSQLEDTLLRAPFAGTVTAVEAQLGEMVSTSPIITLADLSEPLLEIDLEETDLELVSPGYEVEVIFDALPDETFTGQVVRIEPALATVENVPTVLALASLDEEQSHNPWILPVGSNASVDVIAARAENVLLVPIEALRELSPDNYAAFVVVDAELQPRPVEVGLMDYAYAEIVSGLEQGEQVSTGIVETE
jgi:HlyD family secretion protein